MKTLIIYSSYDGQTQKIAQYISDKIPNSQIIALEQAIDLQDFDRIIIGASIRYGHFNKSLYQFIQQQSAMLNQKITAFYGVNLTARKVGKDSPETNVYVRKFLQRIKWQPTISAVFAGALFYPRYKFFDRIMIQFIMKLTGGETDTSKEVEYTDWNKVSDFAETVAQLKNS